MSLETESLKDLDLYLFFRYFIEMKAIIAINIIIIIKTKIMISELDFLELFEYFIIITSIGSRSNIISVPFFLKVPNPNSLSILYSSNKSILNNSLLYSKLRITI